MPANTKKPWSKSDVLLARLSFAHGLGENVFEIPETTGAMLHDLHGGKKRAALVDLQRMMMPETVEVPEDVDAGGALIEWKINQGLRERIAERDTRIETESLAGVSVEALERALLDRKVSE